MIADRCPAATTLYITCSPTHTLRSNNPDLMSGLLLISTKKVSLLTISVLPVIESFTDTVWVCRDSSVTLSVKVKEGGDYTYELYQVIWISRLYTTHKSTVNSPQALPHK